MWTEDAAHTPLALRMRCQIPLPGAVVSTCNVPSGRAPEETELIEPLVSMWVALDHVPLVLRVLSQIPDPGTRPWKCNVPSGSPADAMSVTEPLVSMWMALAAQVPLALRTRSQVPLPGTRVNTCSVPFGNDAAASAAARRFGGFPRASHSANSGRCWRTMMLTEHDGGSPTDETTRPTFAASTRSIYRMPSMSPSPI